MIQLELYLKEISNFLRTITIKNTFIADHMFNTWVSDEYKSTVRNPSTGECNYSLHPYYRNLMGDYILFDYSSLEQAYGIYKERLTAAEYTEKFNSVIAPLVEEYGLKITTTIPSRVPGEPGIEIPNEKLYTRCNVLPIVSSFDTKEKIPFTKNLLKGKHTNTAEIYKIPNTRYYKLLEKYPTSSDIIKAIVYPVTLTTDEKNAGVTVLDKIVSADNFSLLGYDELELETQERQSMYECAQSTLDMIRRRYAVGEYCFENMYPQAHQYLVWQILWLALFVQRIANIRTGNAHTYHIWSYLKSNGLGEYRDILTIRQQQFLYRNLRYLIEHKGTEHALEILIYTLLSSQNISLQGKNTKQMTHDLLGTGTLQDTARKSAAIQTISVAKHMLDAIANMYRENPQTRFQEVLEYMGSAAGQNNLNDQEVYEAGTTEDLDTVYKREQESGLEYANDYLFKKSTDTTSELLEASPISHRNTKLLELTNGTSSDLYTQLYTKFVTESLIYRAYLGDLNFSVTFTVPGSPLQIVLPAKDVLGIIFYIVGKINRLKLYETTEAGKTPTTYKTRSDFVGVDPKDLGSVTGQGTPEYDTSKITALWRYGLRKFQNWSLGDKPPSQFQVEYPYKTIFNGVEQDFPAISDTFTWNNAVMHTPGYLRNIVLVYYAVIKDVYCTFNIVDTTAEESVRQWETSDHLLISFYSNRKVWTISNAASTILYRTNPLDNFRSNIEAMQWYTVSGEPVDLEITVGKREYVLDTNMKNYHGKFVKASDFAEKVHSQAMDFIQLFLEDSSNGEAIYHSLYEKIKSERYVRATIPLKLLNGKTYTKYLAADDDYIKVLKQTFDDYDREEDASLLYSKLLDSILDALFPVEDALLSGGDYLTGEKYKKLIALFKSMLPYNLAFITSVYEGVTSTIFRPVKLSIRYEYFLRSAAEVDIYREDCRTRYFAIYPTGDISSQTRLVWHSITDNDTLDLSYKQAILNKIDEIRDVLDSAKSDGAKKTKIKRILTSTSFTADQVTEMTTWIMSHVKPTLDIRMCNKLAKQEVVNDTIYEPFSVYDYRLVSGATATAGSEYFKKDKYHVTLDRTVQTGTTYYKRTADASLGTQRQYEAVSLTPGTPIEEGTLFVEGRDHLYVFKVAPGTTIQSSYGIYTKVHHGHFNESIYIIGKDATEEQIREFSSII